MKTENGWRVVAILAMLLVGAMTLNKVNEISRQLYTIEMLLKR